MINLKIRNQIIDNVETILFDKDGTFIDLHYFWGKMTEMRVGEIITKYSLSQSCFKPLCLCLGYNIDTKKMIPKGITAIYSRYEIIRIFKKDLESVGINISTAKLESIFDAVSEEFYKNISLYTKPIESAIDFIQKVHAKGVKLGIVTSDSVVSTRLTLEQYGWTKYFDSIVGRETCVETKESGKPTIIAIEELGANPKTTIMIGDSPTDATSARKAGIKGSILVTTGQEDSMELSKFSDYVVDSLAEIGL